MSSASACATNFKVAVGDMQGGPPWELATHFKKAFESRTGGKHQVDLFPKGQLGSEDAMVSNAHIGALDFSILAINKITIFSLTVGLLTLRCVIQSADEATKLRLGLVGQDLAGATRKICIVWALIIDFLPCVSVAAITVFANAFLPGRSL